MRKQRDTASGGARQFGRVGALGVILAGALFAAVLSVVSRVPPDPVDQSEIPGIRIGNPSGGAPAPAERLRDPAEGDSGGRRGDMSPVARGKADSRGGTAGIGTRRADAPARFAPVESGPGTDDRLVPAGDEGAGDDDDGGLRPPGGADKSDDGARRPGPGGGRSGGGDDDALAPLGTGARPGEADDDDAQAPPAPPPAAEANPGHSVTGEPPDAEDGEEDAALQGATTSEPAGDDDD
jgi:hypothetical protein